MQYKETAATKMLTGQWGAAMNYVETHKPIVIKNRAHHDIIMLLATDYEDMRVKCEELEHELKRFEWISISDSLPETDDFFLTLWTDGVIETYQFTLFTGVSDIAAGQFKPISNTFVTHWMPLPKPLTHKED